MGKLKVGDFVKALEGDENLMILPNEIGQVTDVGPKDDEGNREVDVLFCDYDGDFSYDISGTDKEFERVGTKIKWVKPTKIKVGDLILVDGGPDVISRHAVVVEVEQIDHYYEDLDSSVNITFSGDGHAVTVSGKKVDKKVPVIV